MRGAWGLGAALLLAGPRAAAQDDEVVVQAGPVARAAQARDDSVPGSVVQGRRLRAPGAGASEVLRGLPGLTVIDGGGFGALATASIRGATSAQTPVYLAGVRLNDDVGGTADLSTVPLWMVDRVEVYRGHAPVQADRMALGGAIFFDPPARIRTATGASLTAGSFGLRSTRLQASAGGPDGGVLASFSGQQAANDYAYRDDRGTRFDPADDRTRRRTNADTRGREVWLLARGRPEPGTRLLALVSAVDREQGVPGLGLLPTRAARTSLQRQLGAVRAERRCADDRCELALTTTALRSETRLDDPRRELALGGTSLRSEGTRVEQSALLRHDVGERGEVTGALDVAAERLRQEVTRPTVATRRFSRAAVAAAWRGPGVTLRALLAGECHGVAAGALCDLPVPAARLGAQGSLGPGDWLVNAGRYGRAPTLGERQGVSAVVRGNPELASESGLVLDGGWRGRGDLGGVPVALEVFAFAQRIDDLVVYQRSSLGYLRPYNVGHTRTLGLESALRAAPFTWLRLELTATVLDPRDTSSARLGDNDLLPFRSRLQAAPAAEIRLGSLPPLGLVEATLEGRYLHQSSRYGDRSGQIVLAAQGSLDLDLDTRWWHRRLGLRLRAANVLDQRRSDTVGYPLPGRAFFASLDLTGP